MKNLCSWLLFIVSSVAAIDAAEPPRASITIDRIAEIKYPTNPAFSPDGRMVAFLWDAAGKQDLFVVTPGRFISSAEPTCSATRGAGSKTSSIVS